MDIGFIFFGGIFITMGQTYSSKEKRFLIQYAGNTQTHKIIWVVAF